MSANQTASDLDRAITETPYDPVAWSSLVGMTGVKALIERRVLLPIQERERARKHGVAPASTILLFGPPGTGKTALVQAIAGRMGWALVDVDLSTVAVSSARLRVLFERLFRLEDVVIFFDEFEHLGLKRDSQTTPGEPLTAELLRCLPSAHEQGRLLVIAATNYIRLLDPALLRPGRFDMVIPLGFPDIEERIVLLNHFLARHRCRDIDMRTAAELSDGLSPADIEAVCQRAAQFAFEREIASGKESHIETTDLQTILDGYRGSLSSDDLETFQDDSVQFQRF